MRAWGGGARPLAQTTHLARAVELRGSARIDVLVDATPSKDVELACCRVDQPFVVELAVQSLAQPDALGLSGRAREERRAHARNVR